MSNGTWAIVELFGHAKVAGWVEKDERFGPALVRVDVPSVKPAVDEEAIPSHSSFYGNGAIYALHPVSEEIARQVAGEIQHRPVLVYTLTHRSEQLRLTDRDDEFDDDDED